MSRTSNRPFDAVLTAPFGAVGVRTHAGAVTEIVYLPPGTGRVVPTNSLAERAVRQIERYLDDSRAPFDLPLSAQGTPFRERVWKAIAAIPAGETRTYGELSDRLGSSARAVGQACGDNPLPIVVPCHRVVSATGVGGFAHASDGFLIRAKRWLLTHEGIPV